MRKIITMLKNYLKVAYRNILKNKGTTLINAFGMALAIGCCMVVYEFIDWSFSFDKHHTKREQIYVVQREMDFNGALSLWNDVPQGLGLALKKDLPQVEEVVRVTNKRGTIKYEDRVFGERISFVDEAYFKMFDFGVKWGTPSDFAEGAGIVITDPIAQKYFGEKNPIGETINLRFVENGKEILAPCVIKSVLEKNPSNSSFANHIMLPFHRQSLFEGSEATWTQLANPTFIQVNAEEAIAEITSSEKKYVDIINTANPDWKMTSIHCMPFKYITREAYRVRNSYFANILMLGIVVMGLIGFFLLLMACFNYLNIALASANTRLKEISVRKVLGGSRQQIITQFLVENFIICTCSLILGLVFAQFLFIPWFNELIGQGEILNLSFLSNPRTWLFTLSLLVFIIIAGAGYPAFYISKYQPVAILKKEFKLGSKSSFQKGLIGAQLFLSIITIFITISGLLLNEDLRTKDWGYNQNNLAVIQLEDSKDFEAFKITIEAHPDVLAVAGSQQQIGHGLQQLKAQVAGEKYDVEGITVAPDYLQTLEIPLLEGRHFDAQQETDKTESILVNESFRQLMNWDQAVGQTVKLADQSYRIIGEVQNVYQSDFVQKIKPIFKMGAAEQMGFVSIRTQPDKANSTIKALRSKWTEFYPNAPYSYFFQDNAFFGYFIIFNQGAAILSGASIMTILICTIGLFGLAMLLLHRKMKEISIRKVLGASKLQIAQMIQKDFFLPLFLAMLLALPVGFWFMKVVRDQFAPTTVIGYLPFLLTIGSLVLMVVFSLSKHIYTAIRSEPSQFLRDE